METRNVVAVSVEDCHPVKVGVQPNGSMCPVYCDWDGVHQCPMNSGSPSGSKSTHTCVCDIGYHPKSSYTQLFLVGLLSLAGTLSLSWLGHLMGSLSITC